MINLGEASVTRAELVAVFTRLKWAQQLLVESDSPVVVHLVTGNCDLNDAYGPFIRECSNIMTGEANFSIAHVYREANQCADCLANLNLTFPLGTYYLPAIP